MASAMPAVSAGAAPAGVSQAPQATLWVGDLSIDPEVTAQDLFDVFSASASVASLRLCRDKATNASRGYAYVNFTSVEEAQKAMDTLNYTEFKGKACRIMWANKDRTSRSGVSANIVIKGLSASTGPKELHDLASVYGTVVSCKMPVDRESKTPRGYGFVQFESKTSADEAIEDLNGTDVDGATITVEAFKPLEERKANLKWTNVYLKQYPRSWSETQVRELVAPFGTVTSLHFPVDDEGNGRGFCLVNMGSTEEAKALVAGINGKEVANPDHKAAAGDAPAEGGPATLVLVATRAQSKAERARIIAADRERSKREFKQSVEGRNLYVKNLDERVTDEDLKKHFATQGTVTSAKVAKDGSGSPLMFGFVCFATREEAEKAQSALHRSVLQGKPLTVTMWQSKASRAAHLAARSRGPFAMRPGMGYGMMPEGGMPNMYGAMPGMMGMMGPQGMGYPNMRGMTPMAASGMRYAGMQPAGQPYMGQGPGPMGAPMARGMMPPGAAPSSAAPQRAPVAAAQPAPAATPATTPATAGPGDLPTAAALAEMDPTKRQRVIGTRLFPLVQAIDAARAPKLTGMLLNGMELTDLLGLLQSPEDLRQSVEKAQQVLDNPAGSL